MNIAAGYEPKASTYPGSIREKEPCQPRLAGYPRCLDQGCFATSGDQRSQAGVFGFVWGNAFCPLQTQPDLARVESSSACKVMDLLIRLEQEALSSDTNLYHQLKAFGHDPELTQWLHQKLSAASASQRNLDQIASDLRLLTIGGGEKRKRKVSSTLPTVSLEAILAKHKGAIENYALGVVFARIDVKRTIGLADAVKDLVRFFKDTGIASNLILKKVMEAIERVMPAPDHQVPRNMKPMIKDLVAKYAITETKQTQDIVIRRRKEEKAKKQEKGDDKYDYYYEDRFKAKRRKKKKEEEWEPDEAMVARMQGFINSVVNARQPYEDRLVDVAARMLRNDPAFPQYVRDRPSPDAAKQVTKYILPVIGAMLRARLSVGSKVVSSGYDYALIVKLLRQGMYPPQAADQRNKKTRKALKKALASEM